MWSSLGGRASSRQLWSRCGAVRPAVAPSRNQGMAKGRLAAAAAYHVVTWNQRAPWKKDVFVAAKHRGLPGSYAPSRSMFIQTERTPNPNSLKFLPDGPVLNENFKTGVDFTPGCNELRQSPLAKELFKVSGVIRVFFGSSFISITKDDTIDWDELKTLVFACIMDFYATGQPVMTDTPIISDTTILDDDDEVVAMIKELLETRIRPAVQEDGGDIFYMGFDPESGIVKLQLAGSCAGCPSSELTLKSGVENMLKHYIPEVQGIEQVEDEVLNKVNADEFKSFESKLKAAGVPTDEIK